MLRNPAVIDVSVKASPVWIQVLEVELAVDSIDNEERGKQTLHFVMIILLHVIGVGPRPCRPGCNTFYSE